MARPRTGKHPQTSFHKKQEKLKAKQNIMSKFMAVKRQRLGNEQDEADATTNGGPSSAASYTCTSATATATVTSSAATSASTVQAESGAFDILDIVETASGSFEEQADDDRDKKELTPPPDDEEAYNVATDDDSSEPPADSPGSLGDLMEIAQYSLAEGDSGGEMDLPEECAENVAPSASVEEEVITIE